MKKKLSSAQLFILECLVNDKDSKLVRDEFLGKRYYLLHGNLMVSKFKESTVSALSRMNILNCIKAEDRSLKYYYIINPAWDVSNLANL